MIAIHPEEADRLEGASLIQIVSIALGLAGETDEALTHLERIALSGPTFWELQLDPIFDVFREQPGFDALLAKARKRVPR